MARASGAGVTAPAGAVHLSFLSAVAVAGLLYLVGEQADSRIPWLRRGFNVVVEVPTRGRSVDFLVALLTTNMGLHLTPRVVREGWRPFLLFLAAACTLFFVQLVLVFPLALLHEESLRASIVTGPLSLMGAPHNLNPPQQVPPVAGLFRAAFPDVERTA